MVKTRKCQVPRVKPSAQSKTRRAKALKMYAESQKLSKKVFPVVSAIYKEMQKDMKRYPEMKVLGPLLKVLEPKTFQKRFQSSTKLMEQIARFPPMSKDIESNLIQMLNLWKKSFEKSHAKFVNNPKGLPLSSHSIPSMDSSQMKDMFAAKDSCAWETDSSAIAPYNIRQMIVQKLLMELESMESMIEQINHKNVQDKTKDIFVYMKGMLIFLKSLPAGPSATDEKERIDWLNHTTNTLTELSGTIKMLLALMKKQ